MSKISVKEFNSESSLRASSTSPTKGLGRNGLAKLGGLAAANKLKGRYSASHIQEIHGLPLLKSRPFNIKSPIIPREGKVVAPCPSTTQYYQHLQIENQEEQDTERPLSIAGERMSTLTPLSVRLDSSPLVRRGYYISSSSSDSSECSNCGGRFSPDNPPPSPTPGAPGLKLDGCKLSYPERSSKQEGKDFKPGFIKKSSFCCGRCECRMINHESLDSPFQSYIRNYSTALDEPPLLPGPKSRKHNMFDMESRTTPDEHHLLPRALSRNHSGFDMESHTTFDENHFLPRTLSRNHSGFDTESRKTPNEHHFSRRTQHSVFDMLSHNSTVMEKEMFTLPELRSHSITEERIPDSIVERFKEKHDLKTPTMPRQYPVRQKPVEDEKVSLTTYLSTKPLSRGPDSPDGRFEHTDNFPKTVLCEVNKPKIEKHEEQMWENYYRNCSTPVRIKEATKEIENENITPVQERKSNSSIGSSEVDIEMENNSSGSSPSLDNQIIEDPNESKEEMKKEKEETSEQSRTGNTSAQDDFEERSASILVEIQNYQINSTEMNEGSSPVDQRQISPNQDESFHGIKKQFSKEDFLMRTNSSESKDMLRDILLECTQELQELTHSGFLPEITAQNGFYYKPNTDKRYNRWKRRKRKNKGKRNRGRKRQATSSSDVSSAEEENDDERVDENESSEKEDKETEVKLLTQNERLQLLLKNKQARLCYNASLDLKRSGREISKTNQKYNDSEPFNSDAEVDRNIENNEHDEDPCGEIFRFPFLKRMDDSFRPKSSPTWLSKEECHDEKMKSDAKYNFSSTHQQSGESWHEFIPSKESLMPDVADRIETEVYRLDAPKSTTTSKHSLGKGTLLEENIKSENPFDSVSTELPRVSIETRPSSMLSETKSTHEYGADYVTINKFLAKKKMEQETMISRSFSIDYTVGSKIEGRRKTSSLERSLKSKTASASNMEKSMLNMAKQHLQKNQSLTNKKYSDGQLISKLPYLKDQTLKPEKKTRTYRNVLDKFVRPLNSNVTLDSSNIRDEDVIKAIRLQRKLSSGETKSKSKSQPMSRKLIEPNVQNAIKNENVRSDLSTLTLNQLLQTMPGKKIASAPKKKKEKQDKEKPFPALDVKKLSVLAKSYNDTGDPYIQEYVSRNDLKPKVMERSISTLSFSRAFTFSVFELPEDYRKRNAQIQRRASSVANI